MPDNQEEMPKAQVKNSPEKKDQEESADDNFELPAEVLAEKNSYVSENSKTKTEKTEGIQLKAQAETLTQLADVRDKFDSNLETGSPVTDKDAAELMRLAKKAGKKVTDIVRLVERKPDGQIVDISLTARVIAPKDSALITEEVEDKNKSLKLWDKVFIRGELIHNVLPPRELIRFTEIVETFYPDGLENAIQQIYRADETSVFAALHESGLLADSGSEFVSDKRITQWVIANEAAIETGEAQPHQAGIERSNTLSSLEA